MDTAQVTITRAILAAGLVLMLAALILFMAIAPVAHDRALHDLRIERPPVATQVVGSSQPAEVVQPVQFVKP